MNSNHRFDLSAFNVGMLAAVRLQTSPGVFKSALRLESDNVLLELHMTEEQLRHLQTEIAAAFARYTDPGAGTPLKE